MTDSIFNGFNLPEPLDHDEFIKLFEEYKNGSIVARNKIVEHNLRLIINRIYKRFSRVKMDKNELFSIGCTGLFKAIETYDIDRNISFSTYAVKCIDAEILLHLRNCQKDNCLTSMEEIITCDVNGNELTYIDILSNNDDLAANYEEAELKKTILNYINELDERSQSVIKLYYGFYDKQYTQQEIAEILNVSRTLVCRIIDLSIKEISKKLIKENYDYVKIKEKKSLKKRNLCEYLDIDSKELEQRINLLTEEEKQILTLHYSNGFDKPVNSKLTEDQKRYLKNYIFPKLKNIKKIKVKTSLCDYLNSSKEEVERAISTLSKYYQIIMYMRYPNGFDHKIFKKINPTDSSIIYKEIIPLLRQRINEKSLENKIYNENSISVQKILDSEIFKELAKQINVKNALVISLTLGYINGISYDASEIANVLDSSEQEVKKITKNCLIKYNHYLNNFPEKPIEKIK